MKYIFTKPTLKFCIAGFFMPGFTAILIFGLQMGITFPGVECANAWIILWIATSIGAVIAPFVFLRLMNKTLSESYNLGTHTLTFFNLAEYTLLQCSLAAFFTNGKTLCYVSDGQNGLEFAFTGWMALPVLVVLSLLLKWIIL